MISNVKDEHVSSVVSTFTPDTGVTAIFSGSGSSSEVQTSVYVLQVSSDTGRPLGSVVPSHSLAPIPYLDVLFSLLSNLLGVPRC